MPSLTPCLAWFVVAQAADSPLLDPPTRAVLLMSLLAFLILGMGLIVGVLLGGRWVRRLGAHDLTKPMPIRRRPEPATAATARQPAMLRHAHWSSPSGDTARLEATASETAHG